MNYSKIKMNNKIVALFVDKKLMIKQKCLKDNDANVRSIIYVCKITWIIILKDIL